MTLTEEKLQFLRTIINIDSVGGEPKTSAPYGKKSREVLEVFINDAKLKGFDTNIFNDKVGYIDYGSGDRLLAILCHLDVVPAGEGWRTNPFELTIVDDCLYGRGIVDDKGPAVASYFALQELKNAGIDPGCKVRLILGTDEERSCGCMEEYVNNPNTIIPDIGITPDAEFPVIFAEKGILQVSFSCKGTIDAVISGGNAPNMVPASCSSSIKGTCNSYEGKSAHGSRPNLGINAILKCIEDIDNSIQSDLIDFIRYYILDNRITELTGCEHGDISGELTTNLGIIDINNEHSSCSIDIRYPATYPLNSLMDYLRNSAKKFNLTINVDGQIDPLLFDKNSSTIKALSKIWENNINRFSNSPKDTNEYLEPMAIGGGTYARHVPNIVAFGPQTPWSEDQCHQANEHISINDFEVLEDVIYEALIELSHI